MIPALFPVFDFVFPRANAADLVTGLFLWIYEVFTSFPELTTFLIWFTTERGSLFLDNFTATHQELMGHFDKGLRDNQFIFLHGHFRLIPVFLRLIQ